LLVLATVGCTSEVRVFISDPPRGAQLAGHESVSLTVDADALSVHVTSSDAGFSVEVPGRVRVAAAKGLGFASARIIGDPLIAVRSWQQGEFHQTGEFLHEAISVRLGPAVLNEGPASVASVIEEILKQQDLTHFVEKNLTFEFDLLLGDVDVEVTPTRIVTKDVEIELAVEHSHLVLRAELSRVSLEYEADAGRFSAPGAAVIDSITLVSRVTLNTGGATLSEPRVVASEPRITNGGRFPTSAVQLLSPLLHKEIPAVFADAAVRATETVVGQLLAKLRPQVGLDFVEPIAQDTRLGQVRPDGNSILLRYDAKILPVVPLLRSERGFLLGRVPDHADPAGATASVGRSMMNQFGHAAWSAGNFENIVFTKQALNTLGLPTLKFPYNRLRSVTLALNLPPIFEWDAGGARVDLGGIEMRLDIRGAPDMKGFTAARIPIDLCREERDLRVCADRNRDIEILDVELNQLSDFADRNVTVGLMQAASRGVVGRVLGSLPAVEVPVLEFEGLDGRVIAEIDPQVQRVSPGLDGWEFELKLVRVRR